MASPWKAQHVTCSLFLIYEGPPASSADLCEWIRDRPRQWLTSHPAQLDVDLFRPASGTVALFDDGPTPAAMLEISATEDVLRGLITVDAFNEIFDQEQPDRGARPEPSLGLFRKLATPVAGASSAVPRTAGLSFVVRYYGPSPDERAFQDFYTANHPPILARFPAIRNVFCYLPVAMPASAFSRSEIMLGNEVVFDDLAHLNAALISNVIADLKADSARFPPFGHSTHHAMQREKLIYSAR